jgi:dolichyl-phosphate-mannose-protein mannosyltransferase
MRSFTATLGALVVPISFITLRSVGVSKLVSGTAATMLLFDNALTTQSRLILLDSYLVFFTATTAMFWCLFNQERHAPFRPKWWALLSLCGLSLGLVASCKWVGLFMVAAVGLYTVTDLWQTFGDVSVPLVLLIT